MKAARIAVRHPVYITMALIALAFFGVFSLGTMNVEFVGNINMPQIYVLAVYPGASAEQVEADVVDILEEDFVTMPGFKSMESQAYDSAGLVMITFQDGIDPYDQLPEVRNRISDLEDQLPDGLQGQPTAMVGGTEMLPIMTISVEVGDDLAAATSYAEDTLKPRLSQIEGVSSVEIQGGAEESVIVTLRTDDLQAKGVSALEVMQVLSYSNTDMPLGSATRDGANTSLRFEGSFTSLDDIRNLAVGATGDGVVIRLSDVADVEIAPSEPDVRVRSGGSDMLLININKRSDGNTMDIVSQVKAILDEEEASLGGAVDFTVIADDSRTISASLAAVIQSGLLGMAIAIIVILLCLGNLQATLTIAISMPLSVFFAFIGMKVMGISVSILSISGIVVALGAIVDGSIVMLEQVHKHWLGKKPDGTPLHSVTQSIYKGSDEVGVSILGSAVTTIIVFVPVTLLDGLAGDIMHDVALAFMFAIAGSAVVAIVVIPYLLKKLLKEDVRRSRENIFTRGLDKLTHVYGNAVGWALGNRKFVIVISVVVLAITVWAVMQLGMTFIPSTDNSEFYVNLHMPSSNSMDMSGRTVDEAEALLREAIPEATSFVSTVGAESSGISFNSGPGYASIRVILRPVAERDGRDVHEIIRDTKLLLDTELAGAEAEVLNGGFDNLVSYMTGGGGYSITLVGDDTGALVAEAGKLKEALEADPEVMGVTLGSSTDSWSTAIRAVNDLLADSGLTSYQAAATTAVLFNGVGSGIYTDPSTGRRLDIRLESDVSGEALDEDLLAKLEIPTGAGSSVSLAAVSEIETESAVSQINHTDRANTVTLSATITGESSSGIQRRLESYLAENPLPDGITTRTAGINSVVEEIMGPIVIAMLIGFFLVFMVMVFQFERFSQPLLVMLTIPFCFIGVALGLLAANSTLNVLSMLGVITLGGTAVNNGIILYDYTNMTVKRRKVRKLTEMGVEADEDTDLTGRLDFETEKRILSSSIADSARNRLKSILMTSLTTMMGVIPMAVATGEGSEIYASLGQAIAGGLAATTLISLFVLPVLYYTSERGKLRKIYSTSRKEAKTTAPYIKGEEVEN